MLHSDSISGILQAYICFGIIVRILALIVHKYFAIKMVYTIQCLVINNRPIGYVDLPFCQS